MGLNLDYSDGQTPLDDDEKEGLLIETIATRGELDEFEQKNIEEALQWSALLWFLGTIMGSKLPSRSLGTSIWLLPYSLFTCFFVVPLRLLLLALFPCFG
jgi:hypothetical protein